MNELAEIDKPRLGYVSIELCVGDEPHQLAYEAFHLYGIKDGKPLTPEEFAKPLLRAWRDALANALRHWPLVSRRRRADD